MQQTHAEKQTVVERFSRPPARLSHSGGDDTSRTGAGSDSSDAAAAWRYIRDYFLYSFGFFSPTYHIKK